MDRESDDRVVLTLDAGGTNFVFSALRGGKEAVAPWTLPARADDLAACLGQLRCGFEEVLSRAGGSAAAISFAFPGPADYPRGIIGDLGNLPAFRGGVALGPMLEERFGVPVFIHNDGDLFALGEALAGFLPWVNARLAESGSAKRYRNLLGVTLGTGFGAGIVQDGKLFAGDNAAAAEIWLVRGKHERDSPAEEGVSARAVRRAYAKAAGIDVGDAPEPEAIAAIARNDRAGDSAAAREAFRSLGECLGDALANALTLVDGLVVVGGGLAGAAPLFMPAALEELNGELELPGGGRTNRLELRVYDADRPLELDSFLRGAEREIDVPGSSRQVRYDPHKRTAAGVSRLGTSRAVAVGAWAYALEALGAR